MTNFLRASGAKEKDIIQFSYDSVNNLYFIDLIKEENLSNEGDIIEKGNRVFQVSNWEVVS